MRRDEIAIDLDQRGLWKPYRVTIELPAGLIITGRGWTANGAFKRTYRNLQAIGYFIENEANK